MGRMEKWFAKLKKRPLLQAAMGAFFLILLLLYMAFPIPFLVTYTEEEITDSLCVQLLHEEEEFDNPVCFLGKEKVDKYIIVGFTHTPHPFYSSAASILVFVEDEEEKGEYHYRYCSSLVKRVSGIYHSFADIYGYCIVINTNPELSRMVNRISDKIYFQTEACDGPAMYIFPLFPDGNTPSSYSIDYAYIDCNGNEMR